MDMDTYLTVIITIVVYHLIHYSVLSILDRLRSEKGPSRETPDDHISVDHEFSPSEDFEIPQDDQDYLAPIITALLQQYAPIKVNYPSNAMLIEHLGMALGDVKESFTARRTASDDHQLKNEDWLKVAVWAIRLYAEGTPHNSTDTLERFTMIGSLSKRELEQYARRTMNQAGANIREKLGIKDPDDVQRFKQKFPDDKLQPYTDDEIQDMKDAFDDENKNQK